MARLLAALEQKKSDDGDGGADVPAVVSPGPDDSAPEAAQAAAPADSTADSTES
jgi:hypothetical protein